jgi:hypothetical protein
MAIALSKVKGQRSKGIDLSKVKGHCPFKGQWALTIQWSEVKGQWPLTIQRSKVNGH